MQVMKEGWTHRKIIADKKSRYERGLLNVVPYHGEEYLGCATLEKAAFAGLTVSSISVLIKIDDVKHQAQVAPITKGSRNVKYVEKSVPRAVMARIVIAEKSDMLPCAK